MARLSPALLASEECAFFTLGRLSSWEVVEEDTSRDVLAVVSGGGERLLVRVGGTRARLLSRTLESAPTLLPTPWEVGPLDFDFKSCSPRRDGVNGDLFVVPNFSVSKFLSDSGKGLGLNLTGDQDEDLLLL